jgi:uncharacterized protein YjeT (DUF2065 family)
LRRGWQQCRPRFFCLEWKMDELLAALCLVVVIEGLLLFALPIGWKRAVLRLVQLPATLLRRFGALLTATGLLGLWLLRGGLAG